MRKEISIKRSFLKSIGILVALTTVIMATMIFSSAENRTVESFYSEGYTSWNNHEIEDVSVNRNWNIRFNQEIDESTLSNIAVVKQGNTFADREMVDTTVELSSDKKTITVKAPEGGYDNLRVYELLISRDVKGVNSSVLDRGMRFRFITEENQDEVVEDDKQDDKPQVDNSQHYDLYIDGNLTDRYSISYSSKMKILAEAFEHKNASIKHNGETIWTTGGKPFGVYQGSHHLGDFTSITLAYQEAKKWNNSHITLVDETIWKMSSGLYPWESEFMLERYDKSIWRASKTGVGTDRYKGNELGKTYPDGWTAPKIQSRWSDNHQENRFVLYEELGFEHPHPHTIRRFKEDNSNRIFFGGNWGGVQYVPDALRVTSSNPDLFEVVITIGRWEREDAPTSYRTPIIYREVLKFYFGDNSEEALNVLSEAPDKGFYQIGNRPIAYDGASRIYLGYPNQSMTELKNNLNGWF